MPTHRSINHDKRRPRELTGRTVLMCLIGFFAVVAGVNAIMIRAAVSTFGGVETANAYQAGLAFGRDIGATLVEVIATDAAGRPLAGLRATALLAHPTNGRGDHIIPLDENAPGTFLGRTTSVTGQWSLVIELSRDGSRMFRSKNRVFLR